MSAPEERRQGPEFDAGCGPQPPDDGVLSLVLGVWLPALTVGVELATRMCAEAFFDPLPTVWHVLAVSLVPLGNLLIWLELRGRRTLGLRHLAFASGTAMAIAGVY